MPNWPQPPNRPNQPPAETQDYQPYPDRTNYRAGRNVAGSISRVLAGQTTRRLLTRTAMGARFFGITRWFWLAEWGALLTAIVLAILAGIGYLQHDNLLSTLVLVIAGLAVVVWLVIRSARHFVERQISKTFARFEQLLARGAVKPTDWPDWYKQNHY